MFQAGLALAIWGAVWATWPQPGEAAYSSLNRTQRAAYHRGPTVTIDRGHWNLSSADPRFDGLAQLLTWDGYQVSRSRQEIVPELLRTMHVLVIADALGWKGAIGFRSPPDAFAPEEAEAVRAWVQRGGSLLLIADHAPAAQASQSIAKAFGARLEDCPPSATVAWFDRDGGLGDDAVTGEVTFAMGFGGGGVSGPADSTAFLTVMPKAVLPASAGPVCAVGKSQGIAFETGKGRAVMLTAQLARTEGLAKDAGINDRLTGNRQLVLNIMHWLSRL